MSSFIKSKKYIGVMYKILKNGDRSYYISFKLGNKYKRIHIGKKSEGITEVFCYQKRNEAINKAKFGDDTSIIKTKRKIITFQEIAERFFEYNKINSKNHKHNFSIYKNHIKEFIGGKSIKDISVSNIKKIQDEKLKKLSPKTVNEIIQLISTIFNYNIKKKYITIDNPAQEIKRLKIDNERLRYLSKEEIKQLLDYIKDDEQLYLFVKLSLQTGGRVNTIVNIKKQDIDLKNKIISLRDYKNNSHYRAFFNDELLKLLKKRLRKIKNNNLVLLYNTKEDNLKTYITKKLQPILNELFNKDIDKKDRQNRVVIHTLRHTFASHLAINGTPIFTIQKLMNHKDISMTLRYAKLAPDSGRDFVEKLYI